MTHLEKLHNKPSHEKRRLAMRFSAVVTGLVFLGWMTTLGPRIVAQITPADDTTTDTRNAGADVSGVVAAVGSAVTGQWQQTQAVLTSVGGDGGASSTDTPHPNPLPVRGEGADQNAAASVAAPASAIVVPDDVPVDTATTTTVAF